MEGKGDLKLRPGFQQYLEEVKLDHAKLQKQIEKLEETIEEELTYQVAQRLKSASMEEAGEATDKSAPKKLPTKKKKKLKSSKGEDDIASHTAEADDQKIQDEHEPQKVLAFNLGVDDAEASRLSEESTVQGSIVGSPTSLKKSGTTGTTTSAMHKVRNHHGTALDPQTKAYTAEIAQDLEEDGVAGRLEIAKMKLEACRKTDNITLEKAGFYLSIAMGRKIPEIADPHEVRWLMFEFFAALMIVVNSLILGLEVAHLATNESPSEPLRILSLLFTNWFVLEVIIRVRVAGIRGFFTNGEWMWNWCDLALVVLSILELALSSFGSTRGSRSPLATVKAIKIVRVARLFRLFRFFPQLQKLAVMVADSVKQLLWALVMFMLIMYVWAVTLTEACTDWIKTHVNMTSETSWADQIATIQEPGLEKVYVYFGSLDKSIYTLFQVSLGGISWHEVTDAVGNVDALSFLLLFAYILFTILALMNVFTGVFVDKAVQNSKKQRKSQIEEAIDRKRTVLDQIVEFFVASDADGDGTISSEEIEKLLHDPVMSAYFDMIGFRPGDARLVADLLDHDGSGDISLSEFITGCERMRGEAKGVDVHVLMMECYQIAEQLDRIHEIQSGVTPDRRLSPVRHRVSRFGHKMIKSLSNIPEP